MMKNPVGSEAAASKVAERPSLYDGAPGIGCDPGAFSILGALDARSKKSGAAKWMVGLITIALLGAVLLFYDKKEASVSLARQAEPAGFAQFVSKKGEKEMPVEPQVAGMLSAMDVSMPSTETKNDSTQPVQSAASLPSTSTPSYEKQQGAMIQHAPVGHTVTDVTRSLTPASVTVSGATPVTRPSAPHAQHTSDKRARSATSKPIQQNSSSIDRSSAKSKRAPKPHVQGKKNDRDVDLIAALLSHVGVAGSDRREAASMPARKTTTLGREGMLDPSLRKGTTPDSGRDVVLQSAGDTTDTLIRRCQSLGFFEGQLCHLRICSGRWGKDAACPVNSQDRSDL